MTSLSDSIHSPSRKDPFLIGGCTLNSRLLLGSSLYPSLEILENCLATTSTEVVTVALRRKNFSNPSVHFIERLQEIQKQKRMYFLPNTFGCQSLKEIITTAQMAREIFQTDWIKLETFCNDYNLQPDPFLLVEAAALLNQEGFTVFPYMTPDLAVGEKLLQVGCKILMPWAAPIGSGRGPTDKWTLDIFRKHFKSIPLIIDAGIGKPSHAAQVMELGYDAILLNTAVAQAIDPVQMAVAFDHAIWAGRWAFHAGIIPEKECAQPSTPTVGVPFWHNL